MRLAFTTLFLLFSAPVFSQWQLVKKVKQENLAQLEVDRKGDIYVADHRGNVSKYDRNGKLLVEYAPTLSQPIHQIDFNSSFKIYLYYQEFQELVVLNRYLASPIRYALADYGLSFVSDIAPDMQQQVWLLDMGDFSLQLLDPRRNEIVERKSLARVLDQRDASDLILKSHDNRSYLIDRQQAVYVFDNLGNYLEKFPIEVTGDLSFWKDEMYHKQGETLRLSKLYSKESRTLDLPKTEAKKIRWTGSSLILLQSDGFAIYH